MEDVNPTKFLKHSWDLKENLSVNTKQATTGRKIAVASTADLYFKWVWWSQNLRTWGVCTYYVVQLQHLNSVSEGTTIQKHLGKNVFLYSWGYCTGYPVSFYIHWIWSKRPQIRQKDITGSVFLFTGCCVKTLYS